ncbi:chemotaxis protein CheW [Rhizobium lusitanum]|uniref:Chemotaxis protein CheW n=1 Tax=Rhizobium lusitanum TaxID=293958 RepID=A0A6L9UGI9_9HYPH|nr:chemotaxis protein CheW [Rhizobium lusitanum]NEI73738.1 chemotaxis protein CheW [Rhizobium lusitanum]
MSLSTFLRRRAAMAVRVHNTLCTFIDGTIVARADNWRPLHGSPDLCHALGHTSYRGELVPVYDLATMLGNVPSHGCQIAIVKMAAGHIAFLIDEFVGSTAAANEAIHLSQLEIFRHEHMAA